ncbi:hypothetical protein PanWU01x14_215450 [Parasponia andersonii]|uniref:Uncharacterized protein n=1 Tax=Parasponia andersonii TaxID=3476 RepID=A0A2P5BS41_PARAD|nr:hypothetical protein PanWU01x14_215450 [Parasponia andersonii]
MQIVNNDSISSDGTCSPHMSLKRDWERVRRFLSDILDFRRKIGDLGLVGWSRRENEMSSNPIALTAHKLQATVKTYMVEREKIYRERRERNCAQNTQQRKIGENLLRSRGGRDKARVIEGGTK